MGRGVNSPHRRPDAHDDFKMGLHASMDTGFFGETEEQVTPVLVIRERRHKMTWAMLVLNHRTHGGTRGLARTLNIGVNKIPPDAWILCGLMEFAAYLMDRRDIGSDGKTPKHRRTDSGIWGENVVHACQTSKRRKVGPAILAWSVRWRTELIVRGSGCHRAGTGDQDT